jgi:hypothetical protein
MFNHTVILYCRRILNVIIIVVSVVLSLYVSLLIVLWFILLYIDLSYILWISWTKINTIQYNTSSLFGPNILYSTLYSNTFSLCSSLNIRQQYYILASCCTVLFNGYYRLCLRLRAVLSMFLICILFRNKHTAALYCSKGIIGYVSVCMLHSACFSIVFCS